MVLISLTFTSNFHYFCSPYNCNLKSEMELRQKLRWLILVLMLLLLFTGCGDLEPEMQDTRTVILNMDFHGKSSSRTSSSVSASELSQYNTHLILALPSWENLTSSYRNYYSSFVQGLMNTTNNKVSLDIPLNTQMKIFTFLFKENYSMSELLSRVREVGYYGESQNFSIGTNTNSLSLGISLIQVPSTETHTGVDTDTSEEDTDTFMDNTAPTASVTTATISNSSYAVVQSTETGTAYLVKTTVSISTLASIRDAADNQSNSVAISLANTDTDLPAAGLADGTYKVYAVDSAGNLSGPSADNVTIVSGLVDIDGNVYSTVAIGAQHWMAENLKVTKYRNGDNITNITSNSDWNSDSSGAYGVYNNNTTNLDTYGRLYNWYAADNSSGLCPDGWHVPTKSEFNIVNTQDFQSNFLAVRAGLRTYNNGAYSYLDTFTYFWTSSPTGSSAWYRNNSGNINSTYRNYGFSIRCLED